MRVHAAADDVAPVGLVGRVGVDFALDAVTYQCAGVQTLAHTPQHLAGRLSAILLDGLDGLQGALELHQFARRDASYGSLGGQAFQVTDEFQPLLDQFAAVGVAHEVLHHVEAAVDGLGVLQREQHPAAHHASAHRRDGAVDDVEQRLAVVVHGCHEFQVADGEFVQAHIALGLDARQVGNVSQLGVLGDVQVVQDGAAGDDGIVHGRDAEALEAACLEVLQQAVRPSRKGAVVMDTAGFDIASVTSMVASGCQAIVFTTGRGTPTGNAIAPVLKVTANERTYRMMEDNMDVDLSAVLRGERTIAQMGSELVDIVAEVASGGMTKAEAFGFSDIAVDHVCRFV